MSREAGFYIHPEGDRRGVEGERPVHDPLAENHQLKGIIRNLEKLLNTIADPVFVKDEQHRWVFLNDAYCAFMGYPKERLLGKTDYDFFPPEEAAVFWAKDDEVFRTGTESENLERFTDASGAAHVICTKKSLYESSPGRRLIVGIIRDVTDRHALEAALRESERRLRSIVEQVNEGITIRDMAGNLLFCNPAFLALNGVERAEDALGKGPEAIYAPDIARVVRDTDRRAIASRAPVSLEYALPLPSGETRALWVTKAPYVSAEGAVTGVIAVARDITDRRALEERLLAQYEQLKELDRLKTIFANAVSHDLRTPLTSIRGYAELLEETVGGPGCAPEQNHVRQIKLGAARLEHMVDDLLDVARLEAGTFALRKEDVDVANLAREIAASLALLAENAGLSLTVEVPGSPIDARIDASRVGRVLLNLIYNAIKFTPQGGAVRVRAMAEDGTVRCEVSDTGIGIDAADQAMLFQRFKQLGAGKARGGTGLGLAISKDMIEAHGGRIGVVSAPGKGSTFWFTLPRGAIDAT